MFKWFKRNKTEPVNSNAKMLHGHDLNDWSYLGTITLKYDSIEHPVFLFVSNTDLKKRSYVIKGYNAKTLKEHHNYVLKYLDPWVHGENEIYSYVDAPSNMLKQWMLDYFGVVWSYDTKWWVSNEQSKYHAAQKKEERARKETPPNVGSGGQKDPVVIQVNFGKKDEG